VSDGYLGPGASSPLWLFMFGSTAPSVASRIRRVAVAAVRFADETGSDMQRFGQEPGPWANRQQRVALRRDGGQM
jgi:hypothetical protein